MKVGMRDILAGLSLMMSVSGGANAALVDRGNGLIYDTAQNITWQQDANLAATTTFGVLGITVSGTMSWDTAQQWIGAMNAANYKGYSDWRLWSALNPDGSGPCSSLNCTGSEFGHLYYVDLGVTAGQSILSSSSPDLGLFSNFQLAYWSGTEEAGSVYNSWDFRAAKGGQWVNSKSIAYSVLAVRTGDVAPVPAPAAAWLFGSGLLGLAGWFRKKNDVEI